MTHVAEHSVPALLGVARPIRRRASSRPTARPKCRDVRWPALAAALDALYAARRRSVRIVDTDCGAGALLLCAVRYARTLGFTAIEARGIDDAPTLVHRAQAAAAVLHDPAIGICFEARDLSQALDEESEFPADIVLWHRCPAGEAAPDRAAACAGCIQIADPDGVS